MAPEENPFAIEPQTPGFEALAHENGFRFWWASELAALLGYPDLRAFTKAVNKAMQVCMEIGVHVTDNIVPQKRSVDGREVEDVKLSRFACYLAAMNGDVRKPEVARAQAYFVTWAEACRLALTEAEGVERISFRGEIKDGERGLNHAAKQAGVTEYAFFQNAGYLGLYNMNISKLREIKGVPVRRSPLDFMGKAELAANLFRITQTEEKIRNEAIQGQDACESAAKSVGRGVRVAMHKMSGKYPEELPSAPDILGVQKQIKGTHRGFAKIDGESGRKKLGPPTIDVTAEPVDADGPKSSH